MIIWNNAHHIFSGHDRTLFIDSSSRENGGKWRNVNGFKFICVILCFVNFSINSFSSSRLTVGGLLTSETGQKFLQQTFQICCRLTIFSSQLYYFKHVLKDVFNLVLTTFVVWQVFTCHMPQLISRTLFIDIKFLKHFAWTNILALIFLSTSLSKYSYISYSYIFHFRFLWTIFLIKSYNVCCSRLLPHLLWSRGEEERFSSYHNGMGWDGMRRKMWEQKNWNLQGNFW